MSMANNEERHFDLIKNTTLDQIAQKSQYISANIKSYLLDWFLITFITYWHKDYCCIPKTYDVTNIIQCDEKYSRSKNILFFYNLSGSSNLKNWITNSYSCTFPTKSCHLNLKNKINIFKTTPLFITNMIYSYCIFFSGHVEKNVIKMFVIQLFKSKLPHGLHTCTCNMLDCLNL